jgi:hypothetical protein
MAKGAEMQTNQAGAERWRKRLEIPITPDRYPGQEEKL